MVAKSESPVDRWNTSHIVYRVSTIPNWVVDRISPHPYMSFCSTVSSQGWHRNHHWSTLTGLSMLKNCRVASSWSSIFFPGQARDGGRCWKGSKNMLDQTHLQQQRSICLCVRIIWVPGCPKFQVIRASTYIGSHDFKGPHFFGNTTDPSDSDHHQTQYHLLIRY